MNVILDISTSVTGRVQSKSMQDNIQLHYTAGEHDYIEAAANPVIT